MVWHVDGSEVEVFLSSGASVEIAVWESSKKIIYVPANLSNEEVRWTIRNIQMERLATPSCRHFDKLEIFDRSWPVEIKNGNGKAYLSDAFIVCYSDSKTISTKKQAEIAKNLLEQIILSYVCKWEDRLGSLVGEIVFRKNVRNPFLSDRSLDRISFDKGLHRFKLSYIDYCVFDALCVHFQTANAMKDRYIKTYFMEVNTMKKTFLYEYRQFNRI